MTKIGKRIKKRIRVWTTMVRIRKEVQKPRFRSFKLRLEIEVELVVLLYLTCMIISSAVQHAELEIFTSLP